jgi:hypothetical protein
MLPGDLEELPGEERGDAADPGVGRLGDDHVVALRRGEEEVPGVGNDQADARVPENLSVEAREVDASTTAGSISTISRRSTG